MIEDYICGEKFKQFCDFDLKDPLMQVMDEHIMYADIDSYVDALSFIHNNSPKKFVLVTHNGDKTINPTGLPHNLVRWFTQNLNFKHPKVSPLPIGLENPHWHPDKIPQMLRMSDSQKRVEKGFCQFNPDTYPKERKDLIKNLRNNGVEVDSYPCINGQNFFQYLFNLKIYKYCFCPRGNGIDTHRIWEALYMGCIPVVKKHTTHLFENSNLPILFVEDWDCFNYEKAEEVHGQISQADFNSELLTMNYWRNKICSHYTK
jgi:hypothetical protein